MGLYEVASQFEKQASECLSDDELKSLLDDVSRELGFEHFAIVHSVSFRRAGPELISLDNYPDAWAEEFVGKRLYLDDPVLQASQRTAKGFRWSNVARMLKLNSRHNRVLERSARYGMGHGFTVPANVPGEPCGSCSFAVRTGRDLPERNLRCAELIAIDAFDAGRRLRGLPHLGQVPHLNRRQRQCVRLLAAGKTDWEIAAILGLSHQTTRRYVKMARARYDVVSRTQLVVRALRDGQIGFDDAITPA
jgi:LuxR family quorum-sensing system transcriptional regulator CciR